MSKIKAKSVILADKYLELFEFIAEKTKDVKSPPVCKLLLEEFQEVTQCSDTMSCLKNRIYSKRGKIHLMTQFDVPTRIRLIFALGAPIESNFLTEIQKEATVEVDKYRRITKYKDSHMEFEKEPTSRTRIKRELVEDVKDESDDDVQYAGGGTPKKAEATPVKKKRINTKSYMSLISSLSRELKQAGSIKREVEDVVVERRSVKREVAESSSSINPAQSKRRSVKIEKRDTDDDAECSEITIVHSAKIIQKDVVNPQEIVKIASSLGNGNELISLAVHTKFLDSISTVIHSLDLPVLENLQLRITNKIEKLQKVGNAKDRITFNELRASILSALLIVSKSVEISDESINLKDFILIFRTTLVGLRIPFLKPCDDKMKGMLAKVSSQQKLPVKKVAVALQIVLEFVDP